MDSGLSKRGPTLRSLALQSLPLGFQALDESVSYSTKEVDRACFTNLVKQLDSHRYIPLTSGYSDKTLASTLRATRTSWWYAALFHNFDLALTQCAYLIDLAATLPYDASHQVIWDIDLLRLLWRSRVRSGWKGSGTSNIGRASTRPIIRV